MSDKQIRLNLQTCKIKQNSQKMINMQLLERQRARLYQNQLRRQCQQKQQLRKNQSMELKSRDQQDIKQKLNVAIQGMQYEKERQHFIKSKLKEENMMLASIKNMYKDIQHSNKQEIPIKGNNFMDRLYQKAEKRGYEVKNTTNRLSQQNHQDDNTHRISHKQGKTYELIEDQRHMQRLKELQALHRKQNQDIKNRHFVQPKNAIEMHKKLQQYNKQYRRSLENFAYNGRDILDSLKRDQSKQIFQRKKRVQSQLKVQMEQKKVKDYIEKQDLIGQPDDLKKSILGSILYKDGRNHKKQYADYLVKQINQSDLKKSSQKILSKQKIQINSIFGGETGPQRVKMLKYIDHNLGIQSEYLKNVQPGNKSNSPFRMSNLYEFNGDNSSQKFAHQNLSRSIEPVQNPQKMNTESAHPNQDVSRKTPLSNDQKSIHLSTSRLGRQSQKQYLSYDLIKGSPKRYQF